MASTHAVDIVRYHYDPHAKLGASHHLKEEYWVVCNEGMTEKWRKNSSIPLLDVVQGYDIFAGSTGKSYRPTKNELGSVFDTEDNEEAIKKILQEGKIVHTPGFSGHHH